MKWLVALFAFNAVVAAAVVRIPLELSETPKSWLIRQGRLEKYLNATQGLRSVGVSDDVERDLYLCQKKPIAKIGVGTPGQVFNIIMDTGSSDLWVTDSCQLRGTCPVLQVSTGKSESDTFSEITKNTTYDSRKSRSYIPIKPVTPFEIGYLAGRTAGFKGIDDIVLSKNLRVRKVMFGQATQNGPSYPTMPHDGILGLALRDGCKIDELPVLGTAAEQKLFDENVFTIHLRRPTGPFDKKLGGTITFGGRDTTNCARPTERHSVIGWGPWKFMIGSYQVGDLRAAENYWYAISDSGTSFIMAPEREVTSIRQELREEGWKGEGLSISCGAKFQLTLNIGRTSYTLSEKSLVIADEEGGCRLALDVRQKPGPDAPRDAARWVLGVPFIQEYCQIHDMDKHTIGFGRTIR